MAGKKLFHLACYGTLGQVTLAILLVHILTLYPYKILTRQILT